MNRGDEPLSLDDVWFATCLFSHLRMCSFCLVMVVDFLKSQDPIQQTLRSNSSKTDTDAEADFLLYFVTELVHVVRDTFLS